MVLSAVEDTLRDQHADFSPTAYFGACLALLSQALRADGMVNKNLATSTVYLVDTVSPFVPAPLLRSKFTYILELLAPALTLPEADAPLIRPSIGVLQILLVAQDAAAWAIPPNQTGPRRAVSGLLSLALDHRPKIRKRVLDALTAVLMNPPPSPALDHPAADMCAETSLRKLEEISNAAAKAKKAGRNPHHNLQNPSQHEPAVIHALQLTKAIAVASGGWPSKKIELLCELLMSVSRSSNEFLTMAVFDVFEVIFSSMTDEVSSAKLPRLMEAISELKPASNDSQLLPPWIAVLSRGYDVSAQVDSQDTFEKMPEFFSLVAGFLSSSSHNIRVSSSECLISFLANCVPDSAIVKPSIYDKKTIEKLAKIATGLLSVKYQASWVEVFNVLGTMFDVFKWRSAPSLNDVIKTVGELRSNESFQGRKEADHVLGAAVAAIGPEAVLAILPLNITNQKPNEPGRVWMLPILRDYVSNTSLAYFRKEFVPLSEALYQRVLDYGNAEKSVEVKIFETLVQQVWSTVPGFCELPLDLMEAFDQPFAELLANVLYRQTELRVDVCRALQNLVESNQAVLTVEGVEGQEDMLVQRRVSKDTAKKNIAHLAGLAGNLLAVLFNVYSQTLPQFRGYILRCINAYLSITSEQELDDTFARVTGMMESSLAEEQSKTKPSGNKMPLTSHTLMDLIVTISIYLPRSSFGTLFSLAAVVVSKDSDPQLIKKAYKLIPRLATTPTGVSALSERSSELQALILSTADKTPSPARRDRMVAIHEIITHLPTDDLHFIPAILSEVVLGCKETNEKARTAAFMLLVHLARRIIDPERNPPETKIRNALVAHMPDDAPDASATIEEFFTMVSAGLAGTTPHMVASSVAALSRLLFDFHGQLPRELLSDLVETVGMFLTSNNREIVRSVLGFVKVVVVSLPDDMLRPRLDSLVPNLMVWSKEHNGRLKSKVKNILERLVRRFGAQTVETLVGEQDRKVVVNIRKERERRKRNKTTTAAGAEDDSDGADTRPHAHEREREADRRQAFASEFDRAVYGSDMSDSDDESDASVIDVDESGEMHKRGPGAGARKARSGKKGSAAAGDGDRHQQYIRELSPDSNPLDLLAPDALASVSSTRPSVRFLSDSGSKGGSRKKRPVRTDADGKLILGVGDADMDVDGAADDDDGDGSGINAYLTAVNGPDALRRGQRGRFKVGQAGVGKRKNDDNDDDGMDVDDEDAGAGMANGDGGGGAKKNNGRRGLGAEKQRNAATARVEKRRNVKSPNGHTRRGSRGFKR